MRHASSTHRFAHRSSVRYEAGPNMTPLVDVVMVILIFLMLVGTFASSELFVQQRAGLLQVASSAAVAPPPGQVPDEPIFIRVESVGDAFTARADRLSTDRPEVLAAGLKRTFDRLTGIGKPKDKLTVVIQPSADTRYRHLMQVYEAALLAGFEKVSFATPG